MLRGRAEGFLSWLLDAAKRGQYKVNARYLEANLSGSAGEAEREVPIDIIVRQCFTLIKNLSWEGPSRIYLFFDELNLSFGSRVQHKRDAVLIRDLIIAVDRINSHFIQYGIPFYVIAAVRSEVLNAVSVPTLEINKILTARGRELRWFSKTASEDAPIADLFRKKVNASEKIAGFPVSADVFSAYFRKNTFGMRAQDLIVELTWCNPRDLILLFGDACHGDFKALFDEPTIIRVMERYSSDSWSEKVEELSVEYAPAELQSLRKLLLDFKRHFKVDEFERRKHQKASLDQAIAQFHSKRAASKVLEDLYRIGVIGQSTRNPTDYGNRIKQFEEHWAYRGDHSFDPAAWMIIHKAFWPFLRLGPIYANR
ncbi:P-loop ATPase, Sll1717 family [Methylorubrum extorquens]|uniref:P-loop ATPase, Sll1717 family n=1 Tax=Methylorubrum extorquens TaxID=408 RepID=UPI003CC9207E